MFAPSNTLFNPLPGKRLERLVAKMCHPTGKRLVISSHLNNGSEKGSW